MSIVKIFATALLVIGLFFGGIYSLSLYAVWFEQTVE